MLEIIPLPALKDNYIWLLRNKISDHVAIVDPSEAKPVLNYINGEGLIPIAIMITHHHWDHVGGIPELSKHYNIPVYTPKTESVNGSTHPVGEGDIVKLSELDLTLNVMDVPGHTAGAVAYYDEHRIFSGDTLFTAGCGRMFEGTPPQMHASLSKFKTLPDTTLLYCGHEYTVANLKFAAAVEPENIAIKERLELAEKARKQNQPTVPASLAEEKQTNPFLRCEEPSVIEAATHYASKTLNDPTEVFATVRNWKDNF